MELWNLAIEPLRRYLAERWTVPIVALIALLIAASCLVAWPTDVVDTFARLTLAILLVFQFRLWDDLRDVERDRVEHPRRVLVNAVTLVPFRAALWATGLGALGLLMWRAAPAAMVAYVVLGLVLRLWYDWGRAQCRIPGAHAAVVLAKYPVFVCLLTPAQATREGSVRLAASLATVYALACGYEWWSETAKQRRRSDSQA